LIVATAGHVDHGKTFLVRNLTGVETDRLAEEQRRGLSISLGYAYWRPDDDTVVGFIDVPGHRRFINNMISGISGIDVGMLVVAADDGVMPQTLEHVQVMRLLGVEHYLLVISKCDRADGDRLQEVCEEAASLLPEGTPLFQVSNTTGAGIEELSAELARRGKEWNARNSSGHFRMSIDRAFHLSGRGLVLTGTITSGVVSTGETLVLQPQQQAVRVRGIHVQDAPSETGKAGDRCALNVSGDLHKDDIERGDWISSEDCIDTTSRFDARNRLLRDAAFPLKHLSRVKVHIGAKHFDARLILLRGEDSESWRIRPGESAFAQLVTNRPVLCCHGDRFLLRDYGETATLGGGVVLDPRGSTTHKSSVSRLGFLAAMEQDGIESAIRAALADRDGLLDYPALLRSWNIDSAERPGEFLPGIARITAGHNEYWLAESRWNDVKQRVTDALQKFHRDNPGEPGIEQPRLAQLALRSGDGKLFQPLITALSESGDIKLTNGLLSAADFKARPSLETDKEWQAIAACLRKHNRQIPNLAQLREESGLTGPELERCLGRAQRDRQLVRINANRFAETPVVLEFARGALALTGDNSNLGVAELRDHLGCGRNVLIEVLEYFDSIGFTRRVGNARIVLDRTLPDKKFAAT
jgi:selenocysteine-specific elongation factor